MWEFLTGGTTPWIVVVIGGLAATWWEFRKIRYTKKQEFEKSRYEGKLTKFKETNENLFKTTKTEVLAAIATLNVFKSDPEFEKNTIDVLLNRLYTELDYDVINAILSTLIQESNINELIYIANGLQDINRNFFIQDYPMRQRMTDIINASASLKKGEATRNQPGAEKTEGHQPPNDDLFAENKAEVSARYNAEFKELFSYYKYRNVWHKQVTADAYAMFMRKASLANREDELVMTLFQNDFNYVYMAEVKATKVRMERSAFGFATFVKVYFNNIESQENSFRKSQTFDCAFKKGSITKTTFEGIKMEQTVFEHLSMIDCTFKQEQPDYKTKITNCTFRNLKLSNVSFALVDFSGTKFEQVEFSGCSFRSADFANTQFEHCTGLTQEDFALCLRRDNACVFPNGIEVLHHDDTIQKSSELPAENIPLSKG
jgi:hypothetical protein